MNEPSWSELTSPFWNFHYTTNTPNSIKKLKWEVLRRIEILLYIQRRIDRYFLCYEGNSFNKSRHTRAINNCHSTARFISCLQKTIGTNALDTTYNSHTSCRTKEDFINNGWKVQNNYPTSISSDYAVCTIWIQNPEKSEIYLDHSFIICNTKIWDDLLCFHQYWSGGIYMFSLVSELIETYIWSMPKDQKLICIKEL